MRRFGLALCTLAAAACSQRDVTAPSARALSASLSRGGGEDGGGDDSGQGALYTVTNSTTGNAVRAYAVADDGALTFVADYPTSGTGTGGGLGNQGALVRAREGRFLIAVNAGSNQLSSFRISALGLTLVNTIGSGGRTPVSVTSSGDVLYALNAGGTGNISGFRISDGGTLTPIANSTRALSSASAGAAQVAFAADGEQLVVTEKATNRILTFAVGDDGRAGNAMVHASVGKTPFGFALTERGLLIVSEAFGGGAGASAASSYRLSENGGLDTRSASVPTTQTAACWVAITPDNQFAYLTNTSSNTLTGYRISETGFLARLQSSGISATTGAGPIDATFDRNGRFLYALNGGGHSISIFRVEQGGALVAIGTTSGVPVGATGLAAR